MDKVYNFKDKEKEIYKTWEEKGYFKPHIDSSKKPFTIVLPPPNASGKMHTGNVLMVAIEDLLIRWHRMKGDPTLWVPGTDHAGTETQITFERGLKKEGKSRFSYSREELYQAIWDFVQNNKGQIENQLRQMGASVDWSRYTFTLDDKVIKTVHATFKKMVEDGLIYRGDYMVNYCPKCGTTYADVELKHEERKDPLYYMKYGPFVLATVRPETKFGDTAVAVNPKDKRYAEWIGKEIEFDGLNGTVKLQVIADDFVDMEFGTGVVKVTPAHDKNDYEAGLRHNLEVKPVIDLNGKLNEKAGPYAGLSVFEARKQVVAALQEKGLMDHIDENYIHTVALCKAGHEIEPMVLPNWFVKVDASHKSFKKPALEAVKSGKVKIFPKWQEITYIRWMEEMRDWPISRQNVWGIRIPVWYEAEANPTMRVSFKYKDTIIGGEISDLLKRSDKHGIYRTFIGGEDSVHKEDLADKEFTLEEIKEGLQRVFPLVDSKFVVQDESPGQNYLPETDIFDTWFSSGQWPLVTLGYPDSKDFKYFYPTAVLETGWEIIRLWVSRMIMFGIYLTGEVPFENVYLHGIVRALDGRKMSKSLGNVINPEDYINEYGVDALRMGLISGTANGKDFAFPKDRVIAYKHFGNKIWNMGRFILMMREQWGKEIPEFASVKDSDLNLDDKAVLEELQTVIKTVDEELEKFRFADAAEAIYQFMWHSLADKYIEQVKTREDKDVALAVLQHVYMMSLKLLHPFMPFVTEEIYQKMPGHNESIMIEPWPTK
ncbi:MAG TPA: valine--tRNA ligase [Patescibacteria group bacterium]|nr:valine--tRNA ligase [Patescibacteria group bacterium]